MIVPPKWNPMHPPKIPMKPREREPWGERELKSIGRHTFIDRDGDELDSDDVQWHCPQCKSQYNEAGCPCENCGHGAPNRIVKEFSKRSFLVSGYLERIARKLLGPQVYIETRLKKFLRKEYVEGIHLGNLLYSVAKQSAGEAKIPENERDLENIMDELVDRLFERFPKYESKAYGAVASFFEDEGFDPEMAKVLAKGGPLKDVSEAEKGEIEDNVKKYKGRVSGLLFNNLKAYLYRLGKEYSLKKRREVQDESFEEPAEHGDESLKKMEEGEMPDTDVRTDRALQTLSLNKIEEELTAKYKIEKDLIKRTTDHIEQKIPKKYQGLCMKILQDYYLPADKKILKEMSSEDIKPPVKKTLKEISEETGIDDSTVQVWEKKLRGILADFYKTQKDVMEYVGPKEKAVEIPSYKTYMKEHKDQQESLKEWLRDSFKKDVPEKTIKQLELLAEGKGVKEVAEELNIPIKSVYHIPERYFNKGYEAWYKQLGKGKEGFMRSFIGSLLVVNYDFIGR